jgi:hypothetical protein
VPVVSAHRLAFSRQSGYSMCIQLHVYYMVICAIGYLLHRMAVFMFAELTIFMVAMIYAAQLCCGVFHSN